MPSVGSWNSTTETHLLYSIYSDIIGGIFTLTLLIYFNTALSGHPISDHFFFTNSVNLNAVLKAWNILIYGDDYDIPFGSISTSHDRDKHNSNSDKTFWVTSLQNVQKFKSINISFGNKKGNKVLFTHLFTRQNFCPSLLQQVDKLVRWWVNSTLVTQFFLTMLQS